jgi:hypothetical protein
MSWLLNSALTQETVSGSYKEKITGQEWFATVTITINNGFIKKISIPKVKCKLLDGSVIDIPADDIRNMPHEFLAQLKEKAIIQHKQKQETKV